LDKGAKVNLKDEQGLTALDYAKAQTNLDILNVLWDHGAAFVTDAALAKILEQFRFDLHAKAARSMIAHESPDSCRKFIAEQLLNFQSEQRFTTNQLVEARVCAFRTVSDVVEKSAMEESINASGAVGTSVQNQETIKAFSDFLRELQRDPPVQSKALISAAEIGESGIVKWLLDQHADADAKDDQGITPLMWAALKGSGPTVKILLDAGANVNATDYNGWSATMWSASQGRIETLRMLLAKKPNLHATNKDGKTALIIARAMNQAAAAAVLKEGGATE
jgi:ankyrin repeat protein